MPDIPGKEYWRVELPHPYSPSHGDVTTSLGRALSLLGYKVCPIRVAYDESTRVLADFLNEDKSRALKLIPDFDAFIDRPWNHADFYMELDQAYPDARFILTLRDPEEWHRSYQAFAARMRIRSRWFYEEASRQCYGTDDFLSDKAKMLEVYNTRNQKIKAYFNNATEKLCIVSLEDDDKFNKVRIFLGHEASNIAYPHLRKTKIKL